MFFSRYLPLFLLPATLCAQQLTFATYQGGLGTEATAGIVQDSAGNVYLAGTTDSTDFPVRSSAGGGFVIKLSATGARLATAFFPGVAINAIGVDAFNNVVIAGAGVLVASTGAYSTPQATGFAVKFNSALQTQWTSTFAATPQAVTVDATGIYLAGSASAGFLTTAGVWQTANKGLLDAFVLKLSGDGTTALYATFLGGQDNDAAFAITVDTSGQVYLTGGTASSDFPLASPAQKGFGGSLPGFGYWYGDAFVAKLDAKGANLMYSTYLGGAGADQGNAILVDGSGNAYVAGGTESARWLIGAPAAAAYQTGYAGPDPDPDFPYPSGDVFVAKLSPAGALSWYTYLGGSNHDAASALALDKSGNVYVAGNTDSPDFPKVGTPPPDCHIGGRPFLAELDANGAHLLATIGLSGIGFDQVYGMVFDAVHGIVYLAGDAASEVFLSTPGAAQIGFGGGDADAFVSRLDLTLQPSIAVGCVLNGASFLAGNTTSFPTGSVAPGEIVSLFGVGLGPTPGALLQLTGAGLVATTLGGTQVFFDGIPAPMIYAANGQVNAIVPYGVKAPQTLMTVQRGGQTAGPVPMPVVAAVPAIFTYDGSGTGQAAALNSDYSYNTVANPAARGDYITFYLCGAGLMSSNVDGAVTPVNGPYPSAMLQVTVTIRGIDSKVLYAGAAPGYVAGLMQVNVTVPATIDFGDHLPLQVKVGAFSGQFDITVAAK